MTKNRIKKRKQTLKKDVGKQCALSFFKWRKTKKTFFICYSSYYPFSWIKRFCVVDLQTFVVVYKFMFMSIHVCLLHIKHEI